MRIWVHCVQWIGCLRRSRSVLLFAGWVNRQQQAVIDYLLEENRVLRAAHGPRRLRLTDDQRRRLAVKGKVLGRRRLADIAGIVTPDTILRWYGRSSPRSTTVREARSWSSEHEGGHRCAGGPHGAGEPDVGLHSHSRRAEEPRPRRRPQHDQSDPQGSRHRAGTGARREHALEDVPGGSLGRPRSGRLFHRRSPDPARPRSLRRLLRDEAEDPPRGDCRDHASAGRGLDDAGRSESDRPPATAFCAACSTSSSIEIRCTPRPFGACCGTVA